MSDKNVVTQSHWVVKVIAAALKVLASAAFVFVSTAEVGAIGFFASIIIILLIIIAGRIH